MSGTSSVKMKAPPKTNAEWARSVDKRAGELENPDSQRIGLWVLSTDPDTGNLIASHVDGGRRIVARVPTSKDPDTVDMDDAITLKLRREATQIIPQNTWTLIHWDSTEVSHGEWGNLITGAYPEDAILIPETALYLIILTVIWNASTSSRKQAAIMIDGAIRDSDSEDGASGQGVSGSIWAMNQVVKVYPLHENALIEAAAWAAASDATFRQIGVGENANVFTSISITKVK